VIRWREILGPGDWWLLAVIVGWFLVLAMLAGDLQ
jgi:hypothetical protein